MKKPTEDYLFALAKRMVYPHTPDLVDPVLSRIQKPPSQARITRRLLQVGIIVLLLVVTLGLIPPVRAAILDFIQIGVVRIFLPTNEEPQANPENTATGLPEDILERTATAASHLPLFTDVENLTGEMSLEQAQNSVEFPILLPSLPDGLGKPDRVFVQDTNGKMVFLIWFEKPNPEIVRMSLQIIPEGSWVLEKFRPSIYQETLVDGKQAVWTVGPYPLIMRNGNVELVRMINGNVLIWSNADVTFRLESSLPINESIQVAESLKPIVNSP